MHPLCCESGVHPTQMSLTIVSRPIGQSRIVAKSANASRSLEWLSCSDRERSRAPLPYLLRQRKLLSELLSSLTTRTYFGLPLIHEAT